MSRFIGHVCATFGAPRCCYEASSCGYITVSFIAGPERGLRRGRPRIDAPASGRPDQNVRDAKNLAEYFAAGLLTECFVPDLDGEAVRNLVRSRAAPVTDLHRARMHALQLLRLMYTTMASLGHAHALAQQRVDCAHP